MSFAVGDLIELYSPSIGEKKYHVVLGKGGDAATVCLLLTSEDRFAGTVVFRDSAIPSLPRSETGLAVVSLAALLRYTDQQLKLYSARRLGTLPQAVIPRIGDACGSACKTLTQAQREFVRQQLQSLLPD